MPDFCHLHNHTQYSLLDGASDIPGLMKKAVEDGQKAVAMTDHGNMFGAFKFVQEAHHQGIKPIVGCEFYLVEDRHKKFFSRKAGERDRRYHQLLLAKNEAGYRNLTKLCSLGFTEGLYNDFPRVDKELVEKYHEGLIATSCCIGAELPQLILQGKIEEAETQLKWWLDLFGEDYYIELQRHKGLENIETSGVLSGVSQEDINQVLLKFAKKYNVKTIATNDAHYLNEQDSNPHDILLCINTNNQLNDEKRFKFSSQDYYFKTQNEMNQLFSDVPEAIDTTNEIADKIDSINLARKVVLPTFPLPKGYKTQDDYLKYLTFEGAKRRYSDISERIKERLNFELKVIADSGYPGYFLIVQDFTNQARKMGVSVGPGRGSAAGSAVAYCLGITNIDPIKYNLLFERFLNPERISMPDIDIDFDDEGRSKIIEYVINKYGKNQVAQIITYSTLGAKSSFRDVGRVLGLPLNDVNRITKEFPSHLKTSLKAILADKDIKAKLKDDLNADDLQRAYNLRKLAEKDDLLGETLRRAKEVEGSVRNTGIHACGILITPDDVTNYVPVTISKDSSLLVSQFDNSVAEDAGLLKMDFLGLRTLSIIKDAAELIRKRHKIELDTDEIPLDDEATYKLFQNGDTIGIFQYESRGMQRYLRELMPTRFEDLIAMNALFRPGPMAYIPNFVARKHGREEITYDLPDMEEYLSETYGITVYQEQVMLLSQKLAGFSKGQADALRKGMGKKKKKIIDELYPKFIEGCLKNGHPKEIVDKIWNDWEAFASYAFNKSHSTGYAFVAFQTAWLKTHYPEEFMASVLSHNKNDMSKLNFFMREAKKMNIHVEGPDVNRSFSNFTVNDAGNIIIGLSSLRSVGEGSVEGIIKERETNGPFKDICDISKRVNLREVNKKVLESLALAGAMDIFELSRSQYFAPSDKYNTYIEHIIQFGASYQKKKSENVMSLFGSFDALEVEEPKPPQVARWSDIEKLEKEKQIVGIYVSGHPLDAYRLEFQHYVNCQLKQIREIEKDGRTISVAGIVTNTRHAADKRGNGYCRFVLQDYDGSHDFGLYQESYHYYGDLIKDGQVIYLEAQFKKSYSSNDLYLRIQNIKLLSTVGGEKTKGITIKIDPSRLTSELIDQIEVLCTKHKGPHFLKIKLKEEDQNISLDFISKSQQINADSDFIDEIIKMNITYRLN
jgi:DNA polymerase-3 subunit alpha